MYEMGTFLIYGFAALAGLFIIANFGPHVHRFNWKAYLSLVSLPMLAVILVAQYKGVWVWYVFASSMMLGMLAEYAVGHAYHYMFGHRLWEYWRYAPGGYTSFLVAPFWGMVGLLFALLGEALRF